MAGGIHTFTHAMSLWAADGGKGGASRAADWWPDLWDYVGEVGARLLVIDPASAALADADVSQTGPVRQFLRALTRKAEQAGCGVLIVAHSTKSARAAVQAGEDPGAGAVAGSAAWYDGARGVLTLEPHKDARNLRVLSCVKANYGRTGWGCILREVETAGGFAGLEIQTPLPDVATWRESQKDADNRQAAARNGKRNQPPNDDSTAFPYGQNVHEPERGRSL